MSRDEIRHLGRAWSVIVACILLPLTAFAATAPEADSGRAPKADRAPLEPIRDCIRRVGELQALEHQARSMIVVLPDPSLTPFAREFDVFLLAIQQAMAAENLQFDKSCLPWRTASGEAERQSAGEKQVLPDPQATPGLLVYRGRPPRGDDEPAVDVVYALVVVGEAPPAGAAPASMEEALRLVAKGGPLGDLAVVEAGELPSVTILGPTFSGSAPSLGLALRRWTPPIPKRRCAKDPVVRQRVRIVSGSTTNTELDEQIRSAIGEERMKTLDLSAFRSVATSNDDLQSCLWNRVVPTRVGVQTRWSNGSGGSKLLCPPNGDPKDAENGRVALLVELSAFGQQFSGSDFEVMTFPPHLGALRNAYEALDKNQARSGSARAADEKATMLMTDLTSRLQHGIAMFGRDSTLSSLDLVLNNTLRRLARERVQVVGIIATSVADKIFLAEKVRRYVPDVRMVTIEGDVLLSHPRHHPATSGMLVASSSPLEVSEPSRLQFDFDWAQGVYLATRQLVGSERQPTDPADRWSPTGRDVYVSVVSRTGLSLVEVISPHQEVERGESSEDPKIVAAGFGFPWVRGGSGDSLPIIWRAVVYVASTLLLLIVYAVVRAFKKKEPLLGIVPFELIDWHQWKQADPKRRDHVLHALVALLPVAVGVVYLVVSFPSFDSMPLGWLTQSCLFLLTLGAVYLWVGLVARTGQAVQEVFSRDAWDVRGYLAAVLPALLVAISIVLIVGSAVHSISWFSRQDDRVRELLVDRLLSMSGGVSPIVPMALFASVVVAWLVVALRWRETEPTVLPAPSAQQDLTAGADDIETQPEIAQTTEEEGPGQDTPLVEPSRELWRALDLLARGRLKLLVWVATVLVPMLYLVTLFGAPPLRGIEQERAVDWAATVLLALALMLALGAALSAGLAWRSLRDLLETIDRQPRLKVTQLPRLRGPLNLEPLSKALRSVTAADALTLELAKASRGKLTLTWWHAAAAWLDRPQASASKELHELVVRLFQEGTGLLVRLAYRQLGTLMTFATVALITLFVAIGAYPFEPRRMVLLYLGLLVVAVATLSVAIVLQSRSEPLLKDLTGADGSWSSTRPLLQQLGFYAGLPVFGLLTARFPELRGFLTQWLDPIIVALK